MYSLGTLQERGIVQWQQQGAVRRDREANLSMYDTPFGMDFLRRNRWSRFFPVSPTFNPEWLKLKRTSDQTSVQVDHTTKACNGDTVASSGLVRRGSDPILQVTKVEKMVENSH